MSWIKFLKYHFPGDHFSKDHFSGDLFSRGHFREDFLSGDFFFQGSIFPGIFFRDSAVCHLLYYYYTCISWMMLIAPFWSKFNVPSDRISLYDVTAVGRLNEFPGALTIRAYSPSSLLYSIILKYMNNRSIFLIYIYSRECVLGIHVVLLCLPARSNRPLALVKTPGTNENGGRACARILDDQQLWSKQASLDFLLILTPLVTLMQQ